MYYILEVKNMDYKKLDQTIVVRISTSTYLNILRNKKYNETVSDYVRRSIETLLVINKI